MRTAMHAILVLVPLLFVGLVVLPVPERFGYLAGQWLFTAIAALGVVTTSAAAHQAQGIERRFWVSTATAGALITVSQAYYSGYVSWVNAKGPDVPSLATLLDIAAMLTFLVLVLSLARFRYISPLSRIRYVIDLVSVSMLSAAALYALVIHPWYTVLGIHNYGARLLAGVYPVVGIHIVLGTFRNIVGTRVSRWRPWEAWAAAGMTSLGAGVILWPLWYASAEAGFGGGLGTAPSEVLWLTGVLALFAAGVERFLRRETAWHLAPLPALEPSSGWLATAGLPGATLAAIPTFGMLAYRVPPTSSLFTMYSATTVLAMGAVLARTLVTVVDNGNLLNRSVTDALTGLFNHRYFQERLSAAVMYAERYGEPLSVAVLDLDDFNRVNASAGHASGDGALVAVAAHIRSVLREGDAVCRLGGDEFGIIFPDTAAEMAHRLCTGVLDELRANDGPDGRPVTASIGIAGYPRHSTDRDVLLRMADGAQYWVKYHGKDQVLVYDADVVTALDPEERIQRLQESVHLSAVRALAAAVDARSPGTEHHSRNVAALAVLLARELDLDERTATLLEVAALVHDVGKIGIPDAILHKRGPLTSEEVLLVREHSVLGEHLLRATELDEVLPWVRHHHEHWDGTGYPDGLEGDGIPLEARILALCDAYESLTAGRPYRAPASKAAALQEIDLNLGSRYDPALGELFLRMVAAHDAL